MTARDYFIARLPLFYVFVSGIGFSLQALIVKLLSESGFHASFQVIFFRGFIQMALSCMYMYWDEDRRAGRPFPIFGYSTFVRYCLFMRAFIGYGGIAFTFMAVELISIGDSTVLCMLSPLIASILGFLVLGEPWRIPEFCATVVSLTGALLVAKPPFIFAASAEKGPAFYEGVTYALIASVCAGCAYIFVRLLGTTAKTKWSIVCFWQAVAQVLLSVPGLYLSGQKLDLHVTPEQLGMMLLAGFIGANSQIAMTLGMQREKSALATGMRMSDVAFGFVWQVLFTHDRVNSLSLLGAFLVSTSILIIVVCKPSAPPVAVVSEIDSGIELSTKSPSSLSSLEEDFAREEGFTDADSEDSEPHAPPYSKDTMLSTLLEYISKVPVITTQSRRIQGQSYDTVAQMDSSSTHGIPANP